MYEITEFEGGMLKIRFDQDFEFNCFRHYIEQKFPYTVFIVTDKQNDGVDIILNLVFGKICEEDKKKVTLIDEFSMRKIQKQIKQEIGYTFVYNSDLSINIDDYQDFVNYLIYIQFGQDCEWQEEEVEVEGILEIQNVAYTTFIPDFIIEVMESFYEH